jgi:glycosyltransferase involved in cell wall biosynthesis
MINTRISFSSGESLPSLSVIMPVYNEVARVSAAIEDVLNAVNSYNLELIIVESASTDGTRDKVLHFSSNPHVKLILQDRAYGKGNAVREALQSATKDIICIFDADLEYRFADVSELLGPILEGRSQFVLGSRWLGHSVRVFETENWKGTLLNIAHIIGAQLINFSFGIKARDPFTMWKVFTRESINNIEFTCERFDWDLEVVGELALQGIKPIEIPATYLSRDYSQGKKIRFWKELPVLLRVIFRIFLKRIRSSFIRRKGLKKSWTP